MDVNLSPRVNGNTISRYIGKHVLLVAEAIGITNDSKGIVSRACDGKDIIIYLPPGERFDKRYGEVYGKVIQSSNGNIIIEAMRINSINDDFDVNVYNQVVELSHNKFSHLFV